MKKYTIGAPGGDGGRVLLVELSMSSERIEPVRLNSTRLAAVSMLGSLLVAASAAQPQPAATPPSRARVNASPEPIQPAATRETSELVTLNFPGGTVKDFVDVLRAAMGPTPLNVFVEPDAAKLPVPPMTLKDVSCYHVLRLLDRNMTEAPGRFTQIAVEQSNTPEGSAPLFKVVARSQGRNNSVGFSVLSLNPIIGLPGTKGFTPSALDAKSVLAAVEAAVAAAEDPDSSPPLTLKFHEGSGLLFVRGTNAQREAAQEVVQQLRRDVDAERSLDQAATAGRSSQKILLKGEAPDDLAQKLRKKFEGRCCIQIDTDGKYLIITGDRELVSEAAQLAFINDQAAIQRKEKEGAKK